MIYVRYAYVAVFKPEEKGSYSVHFPDLPGCFTCGDDMPDAVYMAQDALCLWLYDLEQDKKPIPSFSKPNKITTTNDEFTSVVAVDTELYRRFHEDKKYA